MRPDIADAITAEMAYAFAKYGDRSMLTPGDWVCIMRQELLEVEHALAKGTREEWLAEVCQLAAMAATTLTLRGVPPPRKWTGRTRGHWRLLE